jgi:hypothetical protein
MFDNCDKKEIEELKRKVQELETLRGQFSVINDMKENLVKCITTCENQPNKIVEIIQQDLKTHPNQSFLVAFKWDFFIFVMSCFVLGTSLLFSSAQIGSLGKWVGTILIIVGVTIIGALVTLIYKKQ